MASVSSTSPLLGPSCPSASSPPASFRTLHAIPPHNSTIIEDELVSSTEDILAKCPRFRILVLGKSGAGKSSLINATFDVNLANVSHEQSGRANIHDEITSEQNSRFILHDSQGFVAGEKQNFETVEKFIAERAEEPELKDRLHAIWFCMEVPTENGALFERADQNFLNLDLQSVPVVVIFTKFDLLVRKLEKVATDDVDDETLEVLVRQRAEDIFYETCVVPLKAITQSRATPISYVKVSSKLQYRDTLIQLVDETQRRLDKSMWILWALAQRASVDEKIDACIEVGRRKYWRGLAASLHFPGKTLAQCLNRIHDDMLVIWNFNDPNKFLRSQDFKFLMADMVKDIDDREPHHIREIVTSVTGVVGIVVSLIPGAVVVALPTVAGVAIAQWIFLAYKESPAILRLLMAYVCDLATVLQCLFWIMHAHGKALEVDEQLIKLALGAHAESGARDYIHQDIRSFVKATTTLRLHQKDEALERVSNIIQRVRFKPDELGPQQHRQLSMVISEYPESFRSALSTAGHDL